MMPQPSLRTQSQPFELGRTKSQGAVSADLTGLADFNGNKNWTGSYQEIEMQCSCDSILARLIYGYSNYRRTMESLHPNLAAIAIGQSFASAQPLIGGGLGMSVLSGMPPFLGG